jgi:hypothetical protein
MSRQRRLPAKAERFQCLGLRCSRQLPHTRPDVAPTGRDKARATATDPGLPNSLVSALLSPAPAGSASKAGAIPWELPSFFDGDHTSSKTARRCLAWVVLRSQRSLGVGSAAAIGWDVGNVRRICGRRPDSGCLSGTAVFWSTMVADQQPCASSLLGGCADGGNGGTTRRPSFCSLDQFGSRRVAPFICLSANCNCPHLAKMSCVRVVLSHTVGGG